MTAYALAHLQPPATLPEEVFTYMERIQATLEPFGGRFLVHGSLPEVVEGPLDGMYVLIEFPGMDDAEGWYGSDAYQAILPMRTDNMKGTAVLLQGVPEGYDPAATAAAFRTLQNP